MVILFTLRYAYARRAFWSSQWEQSSTEVLGGHRVTADYLLSWRIKLVWFIINCKFVSFAFSFNKVPRCFYMLIELKLETMDKQDKYNVLMPSISEGDNDYLFMFQIVSGLFPLSFISHTCGKSRILYWLSRWQLSIYPFCKLFTN